MKILGIDPGRNTGYYVINLNDRVITSTATFGVTHDLTGLELKPILELVDHVVCESFSVRPQESRRGSFDWDPMETPQMIGSLKTLAALIGRPIHMQNPSVKPVAYGFANMKYQKGKKNMHVYDALAHAVYFAVRNLGAKPL